MGRSETAAGCYVQLACLSQERQQSPTRDRFLLLAAAAACRAGWAEVATDCHRLLTALAPHHQARRFPTIADGLRDEEFAGVVAHWERYCPLERAEMLLSELGLSADGDMPETEQAAWLRGRLRRTFGDTLVKEETQP